MRLLAAWLNTLRTYWVFPLVVLWKFVLALLFVLPPPANDAFFFDGAVVNWLLHGRYVNPSIGLVFPTSATEFFCAYPPGYQAVLAGWMWLFGPSVRASLGLHCVLFSAYAMLALAILRRARATAQAANLGGCFLFGVTFHDRPDSVAHVCGLLAYWFWTNPDPARAPRSRAVGAAFATFALGTSLHVGAMYSAILWAKAAMRARVNGWPWRSMLSMVVVPLVLVFAAINLSPTAWRGFQENLLVTPSLTGLHLPQLEDALKAVRAVPGLLLIAGAILMQALRGPALLRSDSDMATQMSGIFVPFFVATLFATIVSLFVVHANYIWVAAYPQTLVVALWWGLRPQVSGRRVGERTAMRVLLLAAVLLISMRALALSTWGVWCASDVSERAAEQKVRQVITALPEGTEVFLSSAYLYAIADQRRVKAIHSDWGGAYGEPGMARPTVMILTPFDYFRRYRRELERKAAQNLIRNFVVEETARTPVPDALPRFRRAVQHLSWAPVIVRVEWR